MILDELFISEAPDDAAIIFGRFNPPHQGHVAAWKEAAKSPIWYVGTNQSTIGPKDPLPFDVKIKAMETMWPEVKGHIIPEQTWWSLAAAVYAKHGEVNLKIVTDETDAKVFVPGLQKQNGVEGRHGFYKFKSIEWQPAPRVSSATDLRKAVSDNDPEAFTKAAGVPADTMVDGEKFFDLVKQYLDAQAKPVKETRRGGRFRLRSKYDLGETEEVVERIVKVGSKFRLVSKKSGKNLGTYDTKKEAEKRERQVQYFKHVNETGGVGVVANNAKQAKDPRYSTSITADIKPGETQRQAKKMSFKLNKKGQPPLLHSTAAKNTSPNKAYNLGLTESKRFKRKK